MNEARINTLQEISFRIRRRILELSKDGGCFTGASLSLSDITTFLYFEFLHLPAPADPERDYVFLSKGHDVPALYAALVEKGWLEESRLKNHLKTNDDLYWHPNRKIPGIEFHSGSLGHLLSVAMGVAYDFKISKKSNRVVVILGDGELNEGSVWEGFLVASALRLDNLTIIIDRNQFQANVKTESLIPLEPLEDKLRAFGLFCQTVDGHDFSSLFTGLKQLESKKGFPRVLIAETVRGKGLPSIENRADRWFCNFSEEEMVQLRSELEFGKPAELSSEGLCVR